jgi:spore maturation protein CgeB
MKSCGFRECFHLPLAGNPEAYPFIPAKPTVEVGMVWNSNVFGIDRFRRLLNLPAMPEISPEPLPDNAEWRNRLAPLHWPDMNEAKRLNLALETLVRTSRYRLSLLHALGGGPATLAGDEFWRSLPLPENVRLLPALPYGSAVADFYRQTAINLNATSCQMVTGLNQRVYDVPLAGGFLLTDGQAEVAELFRIKEEAAVFGNREELPDLIRHYRAHPEERLKISQAGRAAIMREHLYTHRLQTMFMTIQKTWR